MAGENRTAGRSVQGGPALRRESASRNWNRRLPSSGRTLETGWHSGSSRRERLEITGCLSLLRFPVDADEIKRLGKRFKKLDLDNSGSLSVEEFMSLPELQQNPLVQRVIDIFDTDGNGEVDFKGEWMSRPRLGSFFFSLINLLIIFFTDYFI